MPSVLNPIFNLVSPYCRSDKYVGRSNKGFFVKPTSDDNADGWGTPLTDANGNDLTPGTPGGPYPVKFIGKTRTGEAKCRHKPGTHLYGNISWMGKKKSETNTSRGKWVLTFHGPNTRYFPVDDFVYGNEEKHNDIYCEGRCISVAPHPVLGAALRKYNKPDGTPAFRLVVICKSGTDDLVYIRECSPTLGVTAIGYGETFVNAQKKAYDFATNPDGWRLIGTLKCTESNQGFERTVKMARTPWFFDSTGKIAQCMREAEIKFYRQPGEDVTQDGYVRYKVTVSDDNATLTVVDNTPGFTYTLTGAVKHRPDYSANTVFPAFSGFPVTMHYWKVWTILVDIVGTGEYVIAVDYDDTEEKLLKVELKVDKQCHQWIYVGIDNEKGSTGFSNQDYIYGDAYPYFFDPDFVPYEGDGSSTFWVHIDEGLFLRSNKIKDNFWLWRRLSGTQTEFETGIRNLKDVYLYFTYDSRIYPHYYSIPRPHISFYTEESMFQRQERFDYTGEYYCKKEDFDYSDAKAFMNKQQDKVVVPNTGNYEGADKAWRWTDLLLYWSAEPTYTRTFTVIDGRYPTDYVHPAVEPDPKDFFDNSYLTFIGNMPTIKEMLQSIANNYREGNHAEDTITPPNFCASIKYKDENDLDKYYNVFNGKEGELKSKTSTKGDGLKFYPLGES